MQCHIDTLKVLCLYRYQVQLKYKLTYK